MFFNRKKVTDWPAEWAKENEKYKAGDEDHVDVPGELYLFCLALQVIVVLGIMGLNP